MSCAAKTASGGRFEMGAFQRGLSVTFMELLRKEVEKGGWWRDVVQDPDLLLAVRNEYLNVYWRGQSVFKVWMKEGALAASTHPKYLLNPTLSKQVLFDGKCFSELPEDAIVRNYEGPSTLEQIKKSAQLYAGEEKKGVHAIVRANPSVVDVEIAVPANGEQDEEKLPRIDIAAFREDGNAATLVFWEAKLFDNKELRVHNGNARVIGQIEKYRVAVSAQPANVIESYSRVASNLAAIADMSGGARAISNLVRDVSKGVKTLSLNDPPAVGLLVFGFDQAQRDDKLWKAHFDKLKDPLGGKLFLAAGQPNDLRI
jgi:hypothetical protein